RYEPPGGAFMIQSAIGQNIELAWAKLFIISFELQFAPLFFKPAFRVALRILIVPRPFGVKHEEAPTEAVVFIVSLVDIARCQVGLPVFLAIPDWVVFLATLAAKMERIKTLIPVSRFKLLATQIKLP